MIMLQLLEALDWKLMHEKDSEVSKVQNILAQIWNLVYCMLLKLVLLILSDIFYPNNIS